MKREELDIVLENHKKWLANSLEGECANLSGQSLRCINLDGVNLRHADLIGVKMYRVSLKGAILTHANLCNAEMLNMNISQASLKDVNLSNSNLRNVNLEYADLTDARLDHADFSNVKLDYARLKGAHLSNADLTHTTFIGADLTDANLYSANFTWANLHGAKLNSNELAYVNFSRAILPKHIIQVGPIGSRQEYTSYNVTDDVVQCGCWNYHKGGTLVEFEARVKAVYKPGTEYYTEYMNVIDYFKITKDSVALADLKIDDRVYIIDKDSVINQEGSIEKLISIDGIDSAIVLVDGEPSSRTFNVRNLHKINRFT